MSKFLSKINEAKNILLQKFNVGEHLNTDILGLSVYVAKQTSEFCVAMYEPCVCVIFQGSKLVRIEKNEYIYGVGNYLLATTHIPAQVCVMQASAQNPYVSIKLTFTLDEIYEVLKQTSSLATQEKGTQLGMFFSDLDDEVLEPILRLVMLLNEPSKKRAVFAELIKKEILLNLVLNKNSRKFLASFAMQGSVSNKISHIISRIKDEFNQKLNVAQLAQNYGMSESSLYQNFKIITSLSPIAYQKKIRLQEARTLLANTTLAVSQVAFDVGYESVSQFSREYSRMFGIPPKAHSQILQQGA